MATAKGKAPGYRKRQGYSHALVTLTDSATGKRRDYWLSPQGSPESREAYHRVLAEWEANGRRFPDDRLSGWRKPLDGECATPPLLAARATSVNGVRTPDPITRSVGVGLAPAGVLTVSDLIMEYGRFDRLGVPGAAAAEVRSNKAFER